MILRRRLLATAVASFGVGHAQAGEPLQVAQLVELTGAQSVLGDDWRNGVEMAALELNAAGGVLGRLVQVTTYDAQSSAAGARAAMAKLLEIAPVAVLGPALVDSARGALAVPRPTSAPLLLGGGAADLTLHPCVFRAVPSDAAMAARLVGWLREETRAKRVRLLWSSQEPHREARDALLKAARLGGLELADSVASGDVASDVARLLKTPADALVLLLPPDSAARALLECRKLAPSLPLLGNASLTDAHFLELAGAAAEGVRAHVLLADDPAAPELRAWQERFRQLFKQPPGELAMAGYVALGAVAAAIVRTGAAEPRAVCEALRGWSSTAARTPMLLVDSAWSDAGELSRASWMVEVSRGRAVPLRMLRD
jgi:branched-chain amino acid transport system substrate-binding protein